MYVKLTGFVVLAVIVAGLTGLISASGTEAAGPGRTASGLGIVPGQGLVVHVTVAVEAGQTDRAAVRAALAQQGARELTSEEFSLTGLVHDGPADGVAGNDNVDVVYHAPNSEGIDTGSMVTQSVAPWNGVTASALVFNVVGETAEACPSLLKECRGPQRLNGVNEVAFYSLRSSNTLAVTWSHAGTDEFDIAFNTNFDWEDSVSPSAGTFDAVTVGIHEFGHGAGIGHSDVEGAVMEPSYEGVRRLLTADDENALLALYGGGTTKPPPDPTPPPTDVGTVEIDGLAETSGTGLPLFQNRDTVTFSAYIADVGGAPIAGAAVDVTVEAPNGKVRAASGTTDAAGNATFSYRVNTKRDGPGEHVVTVTSGGVQDVEYFTSQ